MPNLSKIQANFIDNILHDDTDMISHIAKDGLLAPPQQLQIYHNNTYLILTDVLGSSFPVTQQLVGDDFFKYVAHQFIQKTPPEQGDMNNYGDLFPDFLSQLPALETMPYIADMARLEWLRHCCYLSPILPALHATDLQNIAEDKIESLTLTVQPHIYLFQSPYSIYDIWQAHQGDIVDLKDIDLESEPCHIVIMQQNEHVDLWSINPDLFSFLIEITEGRSFYEVINATLNNFPEFQIGQEIPRLLEKQIFIDINI